jgi:hypothetical protein
MHHPRRLLGKPGSRRLQNSFATSGTSDTEESWFMQTNETDQINKKGQPDLALRARHSHTE